MTGRERSLTIRSRAAAAIFAHPQGRWMLLSLVAEPRSVSALARGLGLSLSLVHYHVSRFVKLGLVKVERSERRAGRPIKHYQTVADRFFVPAALIGQAHHHKLHEEMRALLERAASRSRSAGIIFEVDSRGAPRMRSLDSSEKRNECWKVLRLNRSEAASLSDEVAAVLERYGQNSKARRDVYLVHFAAALRK
jgi:DNA-binding MarR family transcriptional regulator